MPFGLMPRHLNKLRWSRDIADVRHQLMKGSHEGCDQTMGTGYGYCSWYWLRLLCKLVGVG